MKHAETLTPTHEERRAFNIDPSDLYVGQVVLGPPRVFDGINWLVVPSSTVAVALGRDLHKRSYPASP